MAMASVTCKCKICGKEFVKTKSCHSRKEADEFEAWASVNCTLCPTCYGREKHKSEPLKLGAALNTKATKGAFLLTLSGNTTEYKEQIKALGYKWGNVPDDPLCWGDPYEHKAWYKRVDSVDELNQEGAAAVDALHVKIENHILYSDLDEWQANIKKHEADNIDAAPAPKPERPGCIPSGRWNGKIYGNDKYGYRIYVDNKEIRLSDDDAKAVQAYANII